MRYNGFKHGGLHNEYSALLDPDPLTVAAFGAALYFLDVRTIAALAAAAAVHELGHLICLRLLGLRIKGIRAEAQGFCIDYTGETTRLGHAAAALAGPAAGLVCAFAFSALSNITAAGWFGLTAGISLLLSLFNLLPVLPLDGGRILYCAASALLGGIKGRRFTACTGYAVSFAMLAFGVHILLRGYGFGLAAAAVWLILSPDPQLSIEKKIKVM